MQTHYSDTQSKAKKLFMNPENYAEIGVNLL